MSKPPYTQEDILEAWKVFVSRGTILKDKVRPIVARSWERCRDLGVDPWSPDFPMCSAALLKKKRKEHEEMLSLASPVMKYLLTIFNNNISICDAEGFIYELITPLKYYPRTLGTHIKEATSGSGAATIALEEHVPVSTYGYEHYRVISQNCGTASAPIRVGDNLIGVINVVNPFGFLPDKALSMMISAAKMIENVGTEKNGRAFLFHESSFYTNLLNCCTKGLVILDHQGTILAANQAFGSILGYPDSDRLAGNSFGSYTKGVKDLSTLMDCSLQKEHNAVYKLKGSDAGAITACLVRKNQISLPQGETQTMLVFDPSVSNLGTNPCSQSAMTITCAGAAGPEEINYIGKSAAWSRINSVIHKTAPFPSNVLLQGETGTGKEVVAMAIHKLSKRPGCFVAINCGAIPKELLHSELFGYEQGAFTGARAQGSIGKFEHAHGGTLLLDEISEMPLDMQVSLLRFLQERVVTRISSNKPKKVDVRIIAATNKDMAELVKKGEFREDLYYRLNVIEINLPPLRERKSDIVLLAEHFVKELSKQFNIEAKPISEDAIQILTQYDWPGNVRELKNVIEKALVLSEEMEITLDVLPDYILHNTKEPAKEQGLSIDARGEREQIVQVLELYAGNISKTAKHLNMARNTLYRKIEKYHIKLMTYAVKDRK